MSATSNRSEPLVAGFAIEDVLGHRTHAAVLREHLPTDGSVEATWMPIEFEPGRSGDLVPLFRSNWTVRSGLRLRRRVATAMRERPLDVLFVHTQVPAVLASSVLASVPTVLSIDATPRQADGLGAGYDHAVGPPWLESWKHRAHHRTFELARRLVAFSDWAAGSLVDDYGVDPIRIDVIPQGVDLDRWTRPRGAVRCRADAPVRVLFVGGDFVRKGGPELLEAVGRVAEDVDMRLDVVTNDCVEVPPTLRDLVTVHTGLSSGSTGLVELFHRADLFCLPTRADVSPFVLVEAQAAGLPTLTTRVGAVAELVADGDTAMLVDPGDRGALERGLRRLVQDGALRCRLGAAAVERARTRFDATTNTGRLVEVLRAAAASDRSGAR